MCPHLYSKVARENHNCRGFTLQSIWSLNSRQNYRQNGKYHHILHYWDVLLLYSNLNKFSNLHLSLYECQNCQTRCPNIIVQYMLFRGVTYASSTAHEKHSHLLQILQARIFHKVINTNKNMVYDSSGKWKQTLVKRDRAIASCPAPLIKTGTSSWMAAPVILLSPI